MTYEWTAEQIAALVPGCTATYDGAQREVLSTRRSPLDEGIPIVRFVIGEAWSGWIDPSTIEPPTADTLTRMAVEAFGERTTVHLTKETEAASTGRVPARAVVRRRGIERAQFLADTEDEAARECARYLAAVRR